MGNRINYVRIERVRERHNTCLCTEEEEGSTKRREENVAPCIKRKS